MDAMQTMWYKFIITVKELVKHYDRRFVIQTSGSVKLNTSIIRFKTNNTIMNGIQSILRYKENSLFCLLFIEVKIKIS